MIKNLATLTENNSFWLIVAGLCVALEGAALFYQYALNYGPCVLCIHVRIIVMAMFIVSLLGLALWQYRVVLLLINLSAVGLWGWLLERSWMLLGVERGFITGSCSFDSGLPTWFAIDKWFPFMFQIWESCGYTPVLLFGITMAEALLVMSAGLLVLMSVLTLLHFRERFLR